MEDERKFSWHTHKRLSQGAYPMRYYNHDLKKLESRRQEEIEQVKFIIHRNLNLEGARRLIEEEGITLDEHHQIHPFD